MTCRKHGFTIIETVVALAVLLIFFSAVALILQRVLENVGQSRVRSVALALGQQKMEVIRNLPFDDVGTVGGIPQGSIPPAEVISINNLPFTVETSIFYVDDPFDGEAPADLINTDYKRVRVLVTWGGSYPSRLPVTFVTNIVPKGVETVSGGGTLMIRIFNALGGGLGNAVVRIDNTQVIPEIHTQTLSNSNGIVVVPGAPPCISCYEITVTKTGHSTDKTYGPSQVANPLQPHVTVIDGEVTQSSFSIDETSTTIINSINQSYQPIANVAFNLRGSKIIGYNGVDEPVYKYSVNANSGGGSIQVAGLEWDTYVLDFTNSAYILGGSSPVIPFALPPKTTQGLTFVASPKYNGSLLVIVKDSGGLLQASAAANLTNVGLGYDQTRYTLATGAADFGHALFNPVNAGLYDLKVSLPGYQEATASIQITSYHQSVVILNPF